MTTHSVCGSLLLLWPASLLLGCGSEGSIASKGSNDWTYQGMGGGSARPGSGGSAGASGTASKGSGGSAPAAGGSGGTMASGSGGAVPSSGGSDPGSGATGAVAGASDPAGMGGTSASGGSGATGGTGATSTGGTSSSGGTSGASNGGTSTSGLYHQLANWVEPAANNPNHHGRAYFIANAHADENGLECTSCHGQNYEGDSGPACANCHSEWRSDCSFCHGSSKTAIQPPRGVFDESGTNTLAVGRHDVHLSDGSSHAAFPCGTCHTIPPDEDVDHTLSYQPSDDLSTPGHHGDVDFASSVTGITFSVDATSGSPATARGTCIGACHSDGRGGKPVTTPYWAGGSWNTGCGNCHSAKPNSNHHGHALGEGGATCADCHAGSTTTQYAADTHFNGKADFLGTVQGEGMTLKADSSCASGVRCNGECHGNNEGHNNACW